MKADVFILVWFCWFHNGVRKELVEFFDHLYCCDDYGLAARSDQLYRFHGGSSYDEVKGNPFAWATWVRMSLARVSPSFASV